jgi:hypothetical protein
LRSGPCLSPSTGRPPPLSRFDKDSSEIGRNVQLYADLCTFTCIQRDSAAPNTGERCDFVAFLDQRSTKLCGAQLPGSSAERWMTAHRERRRTHAHHPSSTPFRPSARLHELAGGSLHRRLAGDDPSLDRRRSHPLLQDARRPATLLTRPARRVRHLDAERRRDPRPARREGRLNGYFAPRPWPGGARKRVPLS